MFGKEAIKFITDPETNSVFIEGKYSIGELQHTSEGLRLDCIVSQVPVHGMSTIAFKENKKFLMLGSQLGGYCIYRKQKFQVDTFSGINNNFYAHYTRGTDRIARVDDKLIHITSNSHRVINTPVFNEAVWFDYHHTVWYGVGNFIQSINLRTGGKLQYQIPGRGNLTVNLFAERNEQSFYVVCDQKLFYFVIDSGFHFLGDLPIRNPSNQYYGFYNDHDSVIWLASQSGLYKYDVRLKQITEERLKNQVVRSVYKTNNGMLLAGTYGNGIFAVHNQQEYKVRLDRNKFLNSTHGFYEDKNGFLWLTSNNGLFKIPSIDIERSIIEQQKGPLYYFRYTSLNGLPTNECNGGCYPSIASYSNGQISIPTLNGLVYFVPEDLQDQFDTSSLFIDHIELNHKLRISSDTIIHTQKHDFQLTVFLTTNNWDDDANLYVEYCLKSPNHPARWSVLQDIQTPITLQNLKGGMHELWVRKRIGYGEHDFTQLCIRIVVPKRLAEHGWFWPIVVMLSLLLLYGVVWFVNHWNTKRKKNLELLVSEKTKELSHMIAELEFKNDQIKKSEESLKQEIEFKTTLMHLLSHDIASPLRYLSIFLSTYAQPNVFKKLVADDIFELRVAAENLENLLESIVQWIEEHSKSSPLSVQEMIPLHELVSEKLKLFELVNSKKGNSVVNSIPLLTRMTNNAFIIGVALQNVLGNATNYTRNGKIEIYHEENGQEFQLIVKNEIGITEQKGRSLDEYFIEGYGVGLKISTYLLNWVNASIRLERRDQHTFAIITIKKDKNLK